MKEKAVALTTFMRNARARRGTRMVIIALGAIAASLFSISRAEDAPEAPTLVIGFSKSVPAVGDRVEVRLYLDSPGGRDVGVTCPDGAVLTRTTGPDGCFSWYPRRYGRYVFRAGDCSETVWVTAGQMYFFVWDTTIFRRNASHALRPRDANCAAAWRRRGVKLVNWAGGEYLTREKDFGDKAFKKSADWLENWSKDSLDKDCDGIAIDEIYVSSNQPMDELCKAVLEFRKRAGRGFDILPFFSGIEWDAVGPMWDLRDAEAPCMEENYWGGEEVYGKRWADVRLFRLDEIGTVLSQAPGFFLDEKRRGPRTIEEFRADIALCRRLAPEMRGISLFNAYNFREADRAADSAIEDYFFKPVVHLHPRNGDLMAQNIGNDDIREGGAVEFLKGGDVLGTASIPALIPGQDAALKVPPGAEIARLKLPEGVNHVYEGGQFRLPENMNPLQVERCSLKQGEILNASQEFTVEISFNKPVVNARQRAVWLKGAKTGKVEVGELALSEDRKSLRICMPTLPEDRYSLRLLSGKVHFRDDDGNPLDGSGNGFCEHAPGLYQDADHFSVDFRTVVDSYNP